MNISERILQLLNDKGLKQKDLALYTGISQSAISDWRKKGTNPSADKIVKICEFLNVSTDFLLTGVDKPNSKNESKLLEIYNNLTPDNQTILMAEALKLQKEEQYLHVAAMGGNLTSLPYSQLIDKDIEKAKNNKINKL